MPKFCVNKNAQPTGEHEVHNLDVRCQNPPAPQNQLLLGVFSDCVGALATARNHYTNVDGCKYCAPQCHKR